MLHLEDDPAPSDEEDADDVWPADPDPDDVVPLYVSDFDVDPARLVLHSYESVCTQCFMVFRTARGQAGVCEDCLG